MCRLSWNLGALTSWNPWGLSRPVMGLLFFVWKQHIVLHILGGIRAQGNAHLPVTSKLLDTSGEYEAWEWPVLWEGRLGSCDMYLKEWCLRSKNSVQEHWFLVLVFPLMKCLLKIRHLLSVSVIFHRWRAYFQWHVCPLWTRNLIFITQEWVINRCTCIKRKKDEIK